jgi:chemosensory pili system protein ChpA (sensor histidine kinase/response regulator)
VKAAGPRRQKSLGGRGMDAATPRRKIILVVEDAPALRGLLSLILEDEDYHVETACDGKEALDKVQEHRPDAILLDLLLPLLDGWAVIDSLNADTERNAIPIIAISSGQRPATVGERGVHANMSKPFNIDTMLLMLEQATHESV